MPTLFGSENAPSAPIPIPVPSSVSDRNRRFAAHPPTHIRDDFDSDDEEDDDDGRDSLMDEDEAVLRYIAGGPNALFPNWRGLPEDQLRTVQILRGQMSNKRVASRKALAMLESVPLETLPESERSESAFLFVFLSQSAFVLDG